MVLRYGVLLAGIAGLSMAGVFYKLSSAPPVAIVAYRMLFATLLTVPLALAARSIAGAQARAPYSQSLAIASIASGMCFAIDLAMWAISLQFTTVASAALFVSTQPLFVALLAWIFLRERPGALVLMGIGVGIAGMAIVAGADLRLSGLALAGDALATFAAFAETGYLLFGRVVRMRIDAPRYTFVVYLSCAIFVWLWLLAAPISAAVSARDLLMALGLAVVVTLLGHTLVSQSLGHMPAAVVAAAFLAQPILAALFALGIIGQAIPATTVLGGMIALAGIGMVVYANERPASPVAQLTLEKME